MIELVNTLPHASNTNCACDPACGVLTKVESIGVSWGDFIVGTCQFKDTCQPRNIVDCLPKGEQQAQEL